MDAETIRAELDRLDAPHKEAVARYDVSLDDRERLREKVESRLRELSGPEVFPYVTFRALSEVEPAGEPHG